MYTAFLTYRVRDIFIYIQTKRRRWFLSCAKRDLYLYEKRRVSVLKKTNIYMQRDLYIYEKRPKYLNSWISTNSFRVLWVGVSAFKRCGFPRYVESDFYSYAKSPISTWTDTQIYMKRDLHLHEKRPKYLISWTSMNFSRILWAGANAFKRYGFPCYVERDLYSYEKRLIFIWTDIYKGRHIWVITL